MPPSNARNPASAYVTGRAGAQRRSTSGASAAMVSELKANRFRGPGAGPRRSAESGAAPPSRSQSRAPRSVSTCRPWADRSNAPRRRRRPAATPAMPLTSGVRKSSGPPPPSTHSARRRRHRSGGVRPRRRGLPRRPVRLRTRGGKAGTTSPERSGDLGRRAGSAAAAAGVRWLWVACSIPSRLGTADRLEEEEHGRVEQDHEHGGKDQEHEREQKLDRRLLRLLLRCGVPASTHLVGKVAHDLPDRNTEPLSLYDRTNERAHRGRVAAVEHVQQGFLDREPHALLLECQAQLFSKRAPDARCRRLNRPYEAEARFDRDDEQ